MILRFREIGITDARRHTIEVCSHVVVVRHTNVLGSST